MKNYYVYILSNKTNKVLYIGITSDLKHRIYQHKNKLIDGFSKKYNVTKLVYFEETNDVQVALSREKQLKKWRREKKDWLINQSNPDWLDLSNEWLK